MIVLVKIWKKYIEVREINDISKQQEYICIIQPQHWLIVGPPSTTLAQQ